LGGTVAITGNAVFGETLTATPNLTSNPPGPLGTLVYQWKSGDNVVGTNATTYILAQTDIGNTITVTVTAENCSGSVTSPATVAVQKASQTAPAAPVMASNSITTITLNTVAGCEYNINSGTYQSSPVFSGLTPETSYTFTQRKAETATHFASPASPSATFSTLPGTPPVLGGTVTITGNAIFGETLIATPDLTSNPPEPLGALTYQWKSGGNITGDNADTYTLGQSDIGKTITVTVTAANCTGSVTSPATAAVQKASQTAPAAPTMESHTATKITLDAVAGCEYNINGGTFSATNVFAGLTPSTTYVFTQRRAETATHLASPASAQVEFFTLPAEGELYTITATVNNSAWGTINPFGEALVEAGESITFIITPKKGYEISDVLVNGSSIGAVSSYTFENVHADGAIGAVFEAGVGVEEWRVES
jgi:hypothetical protein